MGIPQFSCGAEEALFKAKTAILNMKFPCHACHNC